MATQPLDFDSLDYYTEPRLINDPRGASLDARDTRTLTLKGRLAPGVSQAGAQSELTAIAADLERAYPDTNRNRRLTIRTELQARFAEDPPDAMLLGMLFTLALAVLLVACANVAGLLTSRAPARARETTLATPPSPPSTTHRKE